MATPRAESYAAASGAVVAGGRLAPPAWVPATAWQWTDIPGTRWSDYIKTDGTGLAPAVTANDPGVTKNYSAVWEYSGPCYDKANHCFWMFGGGHAGTTINILTRTNIGQDTPAVVMACAPTSEANRRQRCLVEYATYLAQGPYHVDGKPYSPHAYYNNLFLHHPSVNRFVSFALMFIASSTNGSDMGGGAQGYNAIPSFPAGGAAWDAAGNFADIPLDSVYSSAPRVVSADGASVYYWPDTGGLRRFNALTNSHSTIGGTSTVPAAPCCNNGADTSLHISRGSDAGWVVKTCDLSTGVQTAITVSGYALPAGYSCVGVVWASDIGKFVAVWVNAAAYNGTYTTLSSMLVTTLQMTGATTATAELKAMTGTQPTAAGSITGIGYDFGCVLLNIDRRDPVKAIKVA